jgi:hypothetical protein
MRRRYSRLATTICTGVPPEAVASKTIGETDKAARIPPEFLLPTVTCLRQTNAADWPPTSRAKTSCQGGAAIASELVSTRFHRSAPLRIRHADLRETLERFCVNAEKMSSRLSMSDRITSCAHAARALNP